MTDRPILFNGEMVRAILDGRKAQTRRPVRMRDIDYIGGRDDDHDDPDLWGYEGPDAIWYVLGRNWHETEHGGNYSIPCPFGSPGDRLWVRETWADKPSRELGDSGAPYVRYRATATIADHRDVTRWRPSIHMPKWACRLWLEVVSVKVERLRDISDDDADAEGFGGDIPHNVFPEVFYGDCGHLSMPECFGVLWNAIYAKSGAGWEDNPWVWVVTFKVVQP